MRQYTGFFMLASNNHSIPDLNLLHNIFKTHYPMEKKALTGRRRLLPVLLAIALVLPVMMAGCGKDKLPVNGDPEKFTYLTEEYPPFNYSGEGSVTGVSVDILENLFSRMNLPVDRSAITISNWAEAYEKALSTPGTMLFSMVKTSARDTLFKWVGPIAPHSEVLISLSGSGNQISEVTDLNNYFTGVVEGYSSIELLMNHGVHRANIVIYRNLRELYLALAGTREVQFISTSELAHKLIIQAMGYPEGDFARPFIIRTDELYYAFNIETADEMIREFQSALGLLKMDKTADGSSAYEKILNSYNIIHHIIDNISDQMVIDLVNRTAADLEADASGTILKVNQGVHPYKDKDNPALYSFFYSTDVVMIAHAGNPLLTGVSFKGKPDVIGTVFRDEIVSGALANGTGWVDYVYTKTDRSGLYFKTTYYKLATGSDSRQYIVCAGKFR